MSRSRKKQPYATYLRPGTMTAYRRQRAGSERTHERALLKAAMRGREEAASVLGVERAPWDEWSSPRDGKMRCDLDSKYMRK